MTGLPDKANVMSMLLSIIQKLLTPLPLLIVSLMTSLPMPSVEFDLFFCKFYDILFLLDIKLHAYIKTNKKIVIGRVKEFFADNFD